MEFGGEEFSEQDELTGTCINFDPGGDAYGKIIAHNRKHDRWLYEWRSYMGAKRYGIATEAEIMEFQAECPDYFN